jgi:Tol biopolymer transport system component
MRGSRARFVWIACVAMVVSLLALPGVAYALAADGFEPDNVYTEARTLPADGTIEEHTIFPAYDQDWFKFTAVSGRDYVLQTVPTAAAPSVNFDTGLWLFDTDGTTLITDNDDYGMRNYSEIVWTAPADGIYYVRVAYYSLRSGVGAYGFRITDVTGLVPGTISGTVRAGGAPAGGATVAYADAVFAGLNEWNTVTASSEGTYTIDGLTPGRYVVGFRQPGWGFQYFNLSKTLSSARVVVLAGGGAVTGVDAALVVPSPVRGAGPSVRMSLGGAYVQESPALGAQAVMDSQIPQGGWGPDISGDGRYVAFMSRDGSIVPGDANGDTDAFIRDTVSGETTCASVGLDGLPGVGYQAVLNRDGRYVAFTSPSDAWGSGSGREQVYVRDMTSGETTCASLTEDGGFQSSYAYGPAISADGRHVAFVSAAGDVLTEFGNRNDQIYMRDMVSGETTCVSVTPAGDPGQSDSYEPVISGDGRYVAFSSSADDLVAGDTNAMTDVFMRDMQTGVTTRLSVTSSGAQVAAYSYEPRMSSDGRYVIFQTYGDIDEAGTSPALSIFWLDRTARKVARVATSAGGDGFGDTAVSGNGRIVVFSDDADRLDLEDANSFEDVFARDMVTGKTGIVSLTPAGAMSNGHSDELDLDDAGKYVAFESRASNLVANDTNNSEDVFRAAVDLPVPAVPVAGTIVRPWSPYSVRAGRSFEVYGWIKPLHASGPKFAALKFYRLQKGKWVLKKTFWASAFNRSYWSATKYAARIRIFQRGYYKIVATHTAGDRSTLVSPVRFMWVR